MKQFARVLRWSFVGLCVGFIAIQFVQVNRTNPPVEGDFRPPRKCSVCAAHATTVIQRNGVAVVFTHSAGFLGNYP